MCIVFMLPQKLDRRLLTGTSVVLHNLSGGSDDNLIRAYGVTNTSALQVLRGESISGNWKLKVSDHANADQGKLNRWAIKLGLM